MQAVDENIETIHLYVVREEPKKPYAVLPLLGGFLCLVGLVAVTVYSAYHPYYEHERLTLPAHFLPLQTFITTEMIIPTGIKTYPATKARGQLTIYNGSILQQNIPAGMIFTTQEGIEIVIDSSAVVPSGNPPAYGTAILQAHAIVAGTQGNISAYAINQVYGASLYIRNLTSFHGGHNAYSVKVVTPQDTQTATDTARSSLAMQEARRHEMLAKPCYESSQVNNTVVQLFWTCQYVTYTIPPYMKVTAITLVGKTLLVDVVFVARPRIIQFK
ncbi:MAG: baseplate J/gp47 family protein [Ktedonobacteraceae bacterium]|nr:baseplate J/gp47 family protein [Ktedonobacteraceae bacterium]